MKIKMYIVTFRNSKDLTLNLQSLFASTWSGHHLEIFVINNHSDFQLDEQLSNQVKILHNVCRPDFSTGHLSRNWNQAIVNGFKNINNPDCDILIHCQDDTVFMPNWCDDLINLHEKYSFIQMGVGDNFCSYLPDSIKKIGLWDERFCGIGFQEADYFMRARIHNSDNSCINDYVHGRLHNPTHLKICERSEPIIVNGKVNHSVFHRESTKYHFVNKNFFNKKWGVAPEQWDNKTPTQSLIENYIFYPYFELDIPNLEEKNYFIEGKGIPFLKDE